VLLQTCFIAAFALALWANDALAGGKPASTLDVPIDFWVCALHARFAVHGTFDQKILAFWSFHSSATFG
jgi:hypothetical protein